MRFHISNPLTKMGLKEPSRLSLRGALFVARFEGYVGNVYNDPADNATIGFGHLLHYGPVDAEDRANWPHGITRDAALSLLRKDADIAATSVRNYIYVWLSQAQFDALCDFVFNCGANSLRGTRVALAINQRKYGILRTELLRWTHGNNGVELPGLVARREAEATLFLTGNYGDA